MIIVDSFTPHASTQSFIRLSRVSCLETVQVCVQPLFLAKSVEANWREIKAANNRKSIGLKGYSRTDFRSFFVQVLNNRRKLMNLIDNAVNHFLHRN